MHPDTIVVKEKAIACDSCEYTCSSNDALRKHRRSKHDLLVASEHTAQSATIKCSQCDDRFNTREQLRAHVVEQQEVNQLEVKECVFDSALEFENWMEETRKMHCVDFVTRSGGGSRTRYMACSRSGVSKAQWSMDAERVARFPVRSGEECTAFLRTKEREDGKIEARYCLQHFGHEKEPARLRLSKSEKEHIVNLVQEDHNVDWVLNKIQELPSDKESERLYFASRKDVRAVVGQFGLNKGQRDPNDMLSIKKWVEEDAENDLPWNNFFDYHSATNTDGDGFHLGIMTAEQGDLFKQYAYRGVCVDSTHNCTRYKYKLVTLLVFDDIGRGRPCAFYFCKEESAEQFLPFFKAIRERRASLVANTNMAVEQWHRTLKRTYLNGSQNSRIDQVLFYLFKAIEDINRECDVQAACKVLNNQYRIRETHKPKLSACYDSHTSTPMMYKSVENVSKQMNLAHHLMSIGFNTVNRGETAVELSTTSHAAFDLGNVGDLMTARIAERNRVFVAHAAAVEMHGELAGGAALGRAIATLPAWCLDGLRDVVGFFDLVIRRVADGIIA
uniref:C2H2-type domain-containing protein n=1 Tax=Plectus sambesii TaxID=2011161 RepID=A0A914V2Y8_9BILA